MNLKYHTTSTNDYSEVSSRFASFDRDSPLTSPLDSPLDIKDYIKGEKANAMFYLPQKC